MHRALLLAALVGCGGEAAPGIRIDGYHGDPVALDAELARCEAEIEARSTVPDMLDGAWVRFVDEADHLCGRRKVAGCWLPQWDLAVVERGEPVSSTALCHEARHRAQFLIDRTIDMQHTDPRWWRD